MEVDQACITQELLDEAFGQGQVRYAGRREVSGSTHRVSLIEFKEMKSGESRRIVFKAPSGGLLPPHKPSSLLTEVRVLAALGSRSPQLTPRLLHAPIDGAGTNVKHILMEEVRGDTLSNWFRRDHPEDERRRVVVRIGQQIATLHALDPMATPFLTQPAPGCGFNERFELVLESVSKSINRETRVLLAEFAALLRSSTPASDERCVLHGDLSPEQVVLTPQGDIVLIDWETACLGNRAWDVFWLVKGVFADRIFGYTGALQDFRDAYEAAHGTPLIHPQFYYDAAIGLGYLIGQYIYNNLPDHPFRPVMAWSLDMLRAAMRGRLEK